ncbi:MAG: response regulator [Candidatus Zipacnadales bacterium]
MEVAEAANGAEALAALRACEAAVLICVLPLADMSLSTLISRTRRASPTTSIIVLSGTAELAHAVQAGADEYATCPPDRGRFMIALGRALNQRRTVLQASRNVLLETIEAREQVIAGAVEALRRCVEAKDVSCDGHAQRVAGVAVRLGHQCGLPQRCLREIQLAGMLHDLGKIGVDQLILEQPRRLTASEWVEIRNHPVLGADIRASIEPLATVAIYVRHHHDRHDGMGDPDRLGGEEIPLPSRIIAVADAYDAMVQPRPYRLRQGLAYAAREFRIHSGTQWDPFVVNALFQCMPELAAVG